MSCERGQALQPAPVLFSVDVHFYGALDATLALAHLCKYIVHGSFYLEFFGPFAGYSLLLFHNQSLLQALAPLNSILHATSHLGRGAD